MLTPDQFDPDRVEALLKTGKADDARAYREECLKRASGDTAAVVEIAARFEEILQRVAATQAGQVVASPPVSQPPSEQASTTPPPSEPETSAKTPSPTTAPGHSESAAPPHPAAPDSGHAAKPAPAVKQTPGARPDEPVEIKVTENELIEDLPPTGEIPPAHIMPPVRIMPGEFGNVLALKRLEPIQRAGLWLAAGVGSIITLVTILVLAKWISTSPWTGVPSNISSMPPEQAKALVDNIKSLSDMASTRCLTVFDAIVTKALLPVFTSILGYIFGTRAGTGGSGAQSS